MVQLLISSGILSEKTRAGLELLWFNTHARSHFFKARIGLVDTFGAKPKIKGRYQRENSSGVCVAYSTRTQAIVTPHIH